MGCDEPPPTVVTGEAMGTRYHVTLGGHRGSSDAIDAEVARLLDAIEDEASQWRSASWVSGFNASRATEPVAVPGHVWAMLVVAERVWRDSGGALDMTIGPVVELWGFGRSPSPHEPQDAEVEQALERCGMDKLVIDHQARTIRKLDPSVTLDFSAVAKGYAVDRIAEQLDARGVDDYLIAFGGEVRAKGDGPDGEGWAVAVTRRNGSARAGAARRVVLKNAAVATSGGGQQQRAAPGGDAVTHLIDPRTGRPIRHGASPVTVRADSAVLADAWATALSATPTDEREAMARRGGVEWMDTAE
ncbi:MAG: FAD:protein FMN transferase [Phycisphaeraceae bacterium]